MTGAAADIPRRGTPRFRRFVRSLLVVAALPAVTVFLGWMLVFSGVLQAVTLVFGLAQLVGPQLGGWIADQLTERR